MAVASFETSRPVGGPLSADRAVERLLNLTPYADGSRVAVSIERMDEIVTGLAADPVVGPRLALAGCALEVHVVGVEEPSSFSLLLDRAPAVFQPGPYGEAAVKLYMTPEVLASLSAGELHVAMAITEGRIGYEGPVRKVLRVFPLICSHARELSR